MKSIFKNFYSHCECVEDRQFTIAKIAILVTFTVIVPLTIYHFFLGNTTYFQIDVSVLISAIIATVAGGKKGVLFTSRLLLVVMTIGSIAITYGCRGEDGTLFWGLVVMFFWMPLFNVKVGIRVAVLLFSIILGMMLGWLGDTTSIQLCFRYILAAIVFTTSSYYYETAICQKICKLNELNTTLQDKNQELVIALEQIEQLGGLLPICSHCHSIRDDSGYWSKLDRYFKDHSELTFSHGICPDCVRKVYPKLADKILKTGEYSETDE